MTKLTKQILVYEEKDGDETYLLALNDINDLPDDTNGYQIGIYELKDIKTLKIKKELQLK